jgi:hypothetical protein
MVSVFVLALELTHIFSEDDLNPLTPLRTLLLPPTQNETLGNPSLSHLPPKVCL